MTIRKAVTQRPPWNSSKWNSFEWNSSNTITGFRQLNMGTQHIILNFMVPEFFGFTQLAGLKKMVARVTGSAKK